MLGLRLERVFALLTALLLSACITAPTPLQMEVKPSVHSGRFAVTYEMQGALQREQGGFEWRIFDALVSQNEASPMQLLLTSPLGTTVAALQFDPTAALATRASLKTPQGTATAATLSDLMNKTLGWELPLQALLPWLGEVTPAPAAALADWGVAAVSRHENGLPRVLSAHNAARNISLRLVFDTP